MGFQVNRLQRYVILFFVVLGSIQDGLFTPVAPREKLQTRVILASLNKKLSEMSWNDLREFDKLKRRELGKWILRNQEITRDQEV